MGLMRLMGLMGLMGMSAVAAELPSLPEVGTVTPPGQVRLAWDPSASPAVAGYKIYMGPAIRSYTNSVDVGAVTNASIFNVNRMVTNYFAATAYDSDGNESDYSGEAVLPRIPPPTNVVTFSVQLLSASSVGGPYGVFTNMPSFSVTNPVGADFVRATVGVTVTNVAK